jgi:hypothetical protein
MCDLDYFIVEMDMGEAKTPADKAAIPEDLLDLAGCGIGRDIEVLWLPSEQKVAHPSAYEVGMIALLLQAVEHTKRIRTDPLAGNVMFRTMDDRRLYRTHGKIY